MSRDRSNEWIGAMFVGLGLGAAGVAGAMAWVTSMIGPAAIPIWGFAAAGAVLLFRGPIGRALARRISGDTPDQLETAPEVYAELDELRIRVGELEERVDFSERLLTKQNISHEP
jgi:hypothetical protein